MIQYIKQRRAFRNLAREIAVELVEKPPTSAFEFVTGRLKERAMNGQDVRLECAVRRELRKLLNIEPYVDTATRYLESRRKN